MAQEPTTRCSGGGTEQEIISSISSEVLEFQVSCSQIRRNITSGNKRLKAWVEVSEGASTNTYLKGGYRARSRVYRSTKAGASTPATRGICFGDGGVGRRSTKAGASTPATPLEQAGWLDLDSDAQRRPGRQPRRHLIHPVSRPARNPALNEGRGVNPGDTPSERAWPSAAIIAQLRPGRQPRRHDPVYDRRDALPQRLN